MVLATTGYATSRGTKFSTMSTYTKFSSSTKFSRTCSVCTHTHVGVDLLNLVLEYRSSKFAFAGCCPSKPESESELLVFAHLVNCAQVIN